MKKKQFDAQTAKKIINEYAEKINLLSRENNVLRKQLEDANISLKINKEILYSHIKSKKNVSEECNSIISDLKKENERLNKKITWLFTEKAELAKKLYKLEDSLNDKINQITINTEKEKTDKFLYENRLKEKEAQINILRKQLENAKKNNKGIHSPNINKEIVEIHIGDPNRFNTEMNNELEMSRAIIKKYVYLMQSGREKERKLNSQIKNLQEKISSQKANSSFIAPTPKYTNSNNPQLALLYEIFNQYKKEEENDVNKNNLSVSSENEEDLENIDLSFIDNKNIPESKDKQRIRNKTCEKEKIIPKLNFKKVEEKYSQPTNIKVIGYKDVDNLNNINNIESDNLLINQYKSQIQTLKKEIEKYKDKFKKLRQRIRKLTEKNTVLVNTLEIYLNKNKNNSKLKNNENDVSMTPCVNDESGLSSNSIIFKGGTLENINKLNEINKKTRLNQIMTIKNNNDSDNDNNINNNEIVDPLVNIIIKDNYDKTSSDKITTNGSSKN